ncbi:MAG: hypothetical protein U7127_22070 [Phormidium sp.]
MRNTTKWCEPLKKEGLEKDLCEVELGLYLLKAILPDTTADSLWVILTGYPYSLQNWTENQALMLGVARHLLPYYNSKFSWSEALQNYREFEDDIRGYEIREDFHFEERTNITVASTKRFRIYQETLNKPVGFSERNKIQWAEAGKYKCEVKGKKEEVQILPEIANFPNPPSHNLAGVESRNPLSVTWRELGETAEWMDEQRKNKEPEWVKRFHNIELHLFNENQELVKAKSLTINRILHLAGMVSSGKSNLMKVLAVWAWRKKMRVTLVVADVLQIFELTKLFDELGIKDIAPILGNSNKASHLNRLHKAVYNSNQNQAVNQNHPGFQWLSNTCLLTPFVNPKMETAFEIGKQPCFKLEPINTNQEFESESSPKEKTCPAYGVCPSHKKERDLVNASIWIATPGSLIYSRVPKTINRESILYFELACRRSDLVIVDEVDQHQAYLDTAFSPDKTLCKPTRDEWLNKLHDYVEAQLKSKKSRLLENELVSEWWDACRIANGVADKIYHLLIKENDLAKWRDDKHFFTNWLLLREVATLLTTTDPENSEPSQQGDELMSSIFEPYIQDLDNDKNPLFALANKSKSKKRAAIQEWVQQTATIQLSAEKIQEIAVKLEFALLVCLLQNKLYFMTSNWRQVQGILNLEMSDSMWFEAPPPDFYPMIPAMPMGNQLAFQYHKSYSESLGSLQFFRCTGVGRWLLLHFDKLFNADNIASPHLLLMSGTSWAGKSPAYHVDVPVSGVLAPRNNQEIVITSEFLPFKKDEDPLSVSGAGDKKRDNLEKIVTKLVEENYLTNKLKELQGRKILLVVNSYKQVEWVYKCLKNLSWEDQIIALSPDDEDFDKWDDEPDQYKLLQRGQVWEFATRQEVILIAPLKAIERGHNIVDRNGIAVINAAYFLVLPHPVPDDLSYAIHGINRWTIDNYKTVTGENLSNLGENFREAAYRKWCNLLHLSVRLRTLDKDDRNAVQWDIIVSLWQAIGRLIRGNANAQLFWCDAKFAINSAKNEDGKEDTPATSVLVGMVNLLRPYFENDLEIPQCDRAIVQSLYLPFYRAIAQTKKLSGLPPI